MIFMPAACERDFGEGPMDESMACFADLPMPILTPSKSRNQQIGKSLSRRRPTHL
jgi:hypothetical protein